MFENIASVRHNLCNFEWLYYIYIIYIYTFIYIYIYKYIIYIYIYIYIIYIYIYNFFLFGFYSYYVKNYCKNGAKQCKKVLEWPLYNPLLFQVEACLSSKTIFSWASSTFLTKIAPSKSPHWFFVVTRNCDAAWFCFVAIISVILSATSCTYHPYEWRKTSLLFAFYSFVILSLPFILVRSITLLET